MTTTKAQQAESLRQQGNDCVKEEKYEEAMLHYTHALKLEPKNHFLYSNRSLAFLKLQQFYLAMQDASEAIKLQPAWPKGYFRKAEIEYKVENYQAALGSYRKAFTLDPENKEVLTAIRRTEKDLARKRKDISRQPYSFAGIGVLIGVCIVLADQFLTKSPSIQYTILQIILVLVFGGLGFLCFLGYRYLQDSQTAALLEPPIDLLGGDIGSKSESQENTSEGDSEKPSGARPHRKGRAGLARQRYRQGKN